MTGYLLNILTEILRNKIQGATLCNASMTPQDSIPTTYINVLTSNSKLFKDYVLRSFQLPV